MSVTLLQNAGLPRRAAHHSTSLRWIAALNDERQAKEAEEKAQKEKMKVKNVFSSQMIFVVDQSLSSVSENEFFVISDDITLPFREEIPYELFTIFIKEHQFERNPIKVLERIEKMNIKKMQEELANLSMSKPTQLETMNSKKSSTR